MNRTLRLLSVVFITLLLVGKSSFALQYGQTAPNFTLTDSQGNIHTLAQYQGKVVYINFFGYACHYCIGHGELTETNINALYMGNNFQSLGIDDWDGTPSLVENTFRAQTHVTYPLLTYGSGTANSWGVYNQSVVIDVNGIIRYIGPSNQLIWQAIQDTIEVYLNALETDDPPILHPSSFILSSAYPNPFNSQINFEFSLSGTAPAELKIFNLLGQTVAVLPLNPNSGTQKISWSPTNLASGRYRAILFQEKSSSQIPIVYLK